MLISVDRASIANIGLPIPGRILKRDGKIVGLRFLGCNGLRDASNEFRRECQTQGSSEGPLAFALAKFVVGNEGQSRMDVDSKLDLILLALLGEPGLTDGSQTGIDIRSRI